MSLSVTREIPLEDVPEVLGSFKEMSVEDLGWVVLHKANDGGKVTVVLTSPHSDKALLLS
jgi:hypothetical protein